MINFIENSHKEKETNKFGKLKFRRYINMQTSGSHKRNIQLTWR